MDAAIPSTDSTSLPLLLDVPVVPIIIAVILSIIIIR